MDRIEVQQTYSRFQSDLQNLASKIGELEQEAEEHVYVGNAFASSIYPLM
jgi:prefoldin subunit 2